MFEGARDFFESWVRAIADRDFATLEAMVHPDIVTDDPQSGERFRGFGAMRAQLERYPGGVPSADEMPRAAKIVGGEGALGGQSWLHRPATRRS